MQLLRSLLKQILYESVRGDDDRKITDICCHSEKVKEGSLFVCINGYRNNGHEYVPQAVEHGAAVLVVDDRYVIESRSGPVILTEHMKVNVYELIRDRNICVVAVRDTRKALSALSAAFFDHPARTDEDDRHHRHEWQDDNSISDCGDFAGSRLPGRNDRNNRIL